MDHVSNLLLIKHVWSLSNNVKNKEYHTVGTIPKSNNKVVERSQIGTPNIQIHDRPCSWIGTDTFIKVILYRINKVKQSCSFQPLNVTNVTR
jgi:hypothetical protein